MPVLKEALVQAYFMLDEMLIAGELQEPSKKVQPQCSISAHDAQSSQLCTRQILFMVGMNLILAEVAVRVPVRLM